MPNALSMFKWHMNLKCVLWLPFPPHYFISDTDKTQQNLFHYTKCVFCVCVCVGALFNNKNHGNVMLLNIKGRGGLWSWHNCDLLQHSVCASFNMCVFCILCRILLLAVRSTQSLAFIIIMFCISAHTYCTWLLD